LEARLLFFASAAHPAITTAALGFLNDSILSTINYQHYVQDKIDPNGDTPAYHFDGCYFQEGAASINNFYGLALDNANPSNFKATDVATYWGRLLHGCQDFYAHANWEELGRTTLVEDGLSLWDSFLPYSIHSGVMLVEGQSEHPTVAPYGTASLSRTGHVVTVSFPSGVSFGGVITGEWTKENCPDSVLMQYEDLHKDADDPFYAAAYNLATQQTEHEFTRLGALIKNRYGSAGVDKILQQWVKPDTTSQNRARALLDLPPGAQSVPVTFVDAGATWKYLDNGTDQGTAWRNGGFVDSTWKSGAAELGYGDGDEKTVVSFGGSSSNKFITTYFRKTFSVADASKVNSLICTLVRDDGAVVYLNGTEVFRSNIPSGTINYKTLASSQIEDAEWHDAVVSPSLLVNGTNVITCEIHQGAASSSDISFNLKLAGTTTDDPPPPPPPSTGTPVTYIPTGDTWKYLDNGSNQGTAWRALSFSDSTWKSGQAELGYGDGDEATVVGFGGNSSNKFITSYFRRTFSVADASKVTALSLKLLRDDGAVVYLNGNEVYRSNMPIGTIAYNTLASAAIEDTNYYTTSVNPALLATGNNVIAVEIHQAGATSSDISFDFALSGTVIQTTTSAAMLVSTQTNLTAATTPTAMKVIGLVSDPTKPLI
jgi:hypothetical protein